MVQIQHSYCRMVNIKVKADQPICSKLLSNANNTES
jgi:hypothetical protein